MAQADLLVHDRTTDSLRINARQTDAFDIFNVKHYLGPNPYLETAALVFDFAMTGYLEPHLIEEYSSRIGDRYPHLLDETYESYAHLFARTVSEVGRLEMGLHLERWS
ncbi:MAG TPA: cyanophycin synthetase, partial [Cyanophyceae cyanobacterium]